MALTPTERETLIRRYADGPARLRAAFAAVPADAVTWRPKPGEWSAHEVVCHCWDVHAVWITRLGTRGNNAP